MIVQITYKDQSGYPVKQATTSAADLPDVLAQMVTIPSLAPPPETDSIDIRVLPPP